MAVNLYRIAGPWQGAALATAACPRGDDLLEWRRANVCSVVSALAMDEVAGCSVIEEETHCRRLGMDFTHFPIGDRDTPVTLETIEVLVRRLLVELDAGRSVAIHCRMGIGRASLLAACVLVRAGIGVDEAFERISLARGVRVPDTPRQREWVEQFATVGVD